MTASIAATSAKVLVLAGGNEIGIMKKSAARLHQTIPGSVLCIFPGWQHGAASLVHTDVYLQQMQDFFDEQLSSTAK